MVIPRVHAGLPGGGVACAEPPSGYLYHALGA
jgi:hypothetical protein